MIRVYVELWPGGFRSGKTELAGLDISNISDLAPVSDYRVRVSGVDGRRIPKRDCEVHGHRRNREPVLTLVHKALEEAGY